MGSASTRSDGWVITHPSGGGPLVTGRRPGGGLRVDGGGPRDGMQPVPTVVSEDRRPRHRRDWLPWLLVPLAASLAGCAALLTLVTVRGGDPLEALLDPAYSTGASPWLGVLSHAGVLVWTVAAAAAWTASTEPDRPDWARSWLARAAVVSGVAALDDLFLVHEQLGALLPGGERAVLASAGLAVLAVLTPGAARLAQRPDVVVLAVAAVLFLTSVVLDAAEGAWSRLLGTPPETVMLVEEVAGFAGVTVWAGYLGRLVSATRRDQSRRGAGV